MYLISFSFNQLFRELEGGHEQPRLGFNLDHKALQVESFIPSGHKVYNRTYFKLRIFSLDILQNIDWVCFPLDARIIKDCVLMKKKYLLQRSDLFMKREKLSVDFDKLQLRHVNYISCR